MGNCCSTKKAKKSKLKSKDETSALKTNNEVNIKDIPKKRVTIKVKSTENNERSEITKPESVKKCELESEYETSIVKTDNKVNIKDIPNKRVNIKTESTEDKEVSEITKPRWVKKIILESEDETSTVKTDDYSKPSKIVKPEKHYDEIIWTEAEMLSNIENIPMNLASGFINLLNEGCTLPFIARYRKGMVNYLMPYRLQELYNTYQTICHLKKRVKYVLHTLNKSNKLTPEIVKSLLTARNLSEVDLVYSPYKLNTLSLEERARKLGLENVAIMALNNAGITDLKPYCKQHVEELNTVQKVETQVTHIVADIIYKDPRVLQQMTKLKALTGFTIHSSRTTSSLDVKRESDNKRCDSKSQPDTYKFYFDWSCSTQFVKAHQTLAINRGEEAQILSVRVIVPTWFYNQLERFCVSIWNSSYWVEIGLGDAYERLIKPWLIRQVRSDLTKQAHKEAIITFTNNLEKILLTAPIKNRRIAGLDPGFMAGCKIGIIDADGNQLKTCTIYPNLNNTNYAHTSVKTLKELIRNYKVDLIGLGNGTGCRETECWLKNHGISKYVPVVIVPEQGASIYSISEEAQKEHPNMDPNLISALSIARRVLDPLGELVKMDPKSLGVGMYQHDIPPEMLDFALECTVEKVVSLVGVDLNTASLPLLRRIAGLNETRATSIIKYRQYNHGYKTREEILRVVGIEKVTYQQCAGFLKVLGGNEPLDGTIIHPESYGIAKLFAKKIGLNLKDLFNPHFSQSIEAKINHVDLTSISRDLNTDECTMEIIVHAFKNTSHEDNILTFCKPVYSLAVQATEQLKKGMTITGVVRNVVPFGCFVDCGIGEDGLIHRDNLGGNQTPKWGDRVSVTVLASPKPKRIPLKLEKILN